MLFLLIVLTILISVTSSLEVTVSDGRVQPSNEYVGTFTSQIQRNVIDAMFPSVEPNAASIVDEKVLRYLNLNGDYQADVPLLIPSLFVLRLNGSIVDAANLTIQQDSSALGLVLFNNTQYSSIQGGTVDATTHSTTQIQAVSVLNGVRNSVRSVRANSQFETAIGVRGGTQNEVAYCDAGGNANKMSPVRAIWTLATSKAYVHHNHVHHSSSHALDFDAYTASSIAWENLCEDNKDEGIFVEETAHDNVICMNTCRRNGNGIGVYSHTVGPVKSNVFFGNTVQNNTGNGITSGGMGHDSTLHSESNVFFENLAGGNNGNSGIEFNPLHGAVQQNYWFGTTLSRSSFSPQPQNISNNVTVFISS